MSLNVLNRRVARFARKADRLVSGGSAVDGTVSPVAISCAFRLPSAPREHGGPMSTRTIAVLTAAAAAVGTLLTTSTAAPLAAPPSGNPDPQLFKHPTD